MNKFLRAEEAIERGFGQNLYDAAKAVSDAVKEQGIAFKQGLVDIEKAEQRAGFI